ncbi:hypothetical protein GCM10023194_21410 [Planotetraspora phitsanulokensis]|uniref:Uncharacterized protein n=2 Tax=Planotetraspora phitsanulokensis TaxID=575192 RepID=A0A8J3U4B7_9ACTN|nr:hypothetical protein Pph01_32020 [Planotetraspora phitsanulokensis]
MLLRQGERPLLFARVADYYRGVNFLRAPGFRSPVAPCRSDRARALATYEPDETHARWARVFAADLTTAPEGPLHTGRWIITRHDAGERFSHVHRSERWQLLIDDHGYINWFTTPCPWDVVPLRRPSPVDSSRVKAYRKQARDGTLPPILLWWISGLSCYVLLDGHDRFVAALTEDQEPPALVLALREDEQAKDASRKWALQYYAEAMDHVESQIAAGTAHPYNAFTRVNRQLGEALKSIEGTWAPTRAWLIRGGIDAWRRQANNTDPHWLSQHNV